MKFKPLKVLLIVVILINISCVSKEKKPKEYRYYELVEKCGVDEECWNKLWDDFIETMVVDMRDNGILNRNYKSGDYDSNHIGYGDIMDGYLRKMVNRELSYKIYSNFLNKLREVNDDERNVIFHNISYQLSGFYTHSDKNDWSTLEDDFKGKRVIRFK